MSGNVPEAWRKANITPISKKRQEEGPGNCRLACLTSVIEKGLERKILAAITKCTKDKKVIGNNQHEFMKQKSGLIMPLCSKITYMVNERRAGDDVHLDFGKAFSTVSILSSWPN